MKQNGREPLNHKFGWPVYGWRRWLDDGQTAGRQMEDWMAAAGAGKTSHVSNNAGEQNTEYGRGFRPRVRLYRGRIGQNRREGSGSVSAGGGREEGMEGPRPRASDQRRLLALGAQDTRSINNTHRLLGQLSSQLWRREVHKHGVRPTRQCQCCYQGTISRRGAFSSPNRSRPPSLHSVA